MVIIIIIEGEINDNYGESVATVVWTDTCSVEQITECSQHRAFVY